MTSFEDVQELIVANRDLVQNACTVLRRRLALDRVMPFRRRTLAYRLLARYSATISEPMILAAIPDMARDLMALDGRYFVRKSLGTGASGFTRHIYLPLLADSDFQIARGSDSLPRGFRVLSLEAFAGEHGPCSGA